MPVDPLLLLLLPALCSLVEFRLDPVILTAGVGVVTFVFAGGCVTVAAEIDGTAVVAGIAATDKITVLPLLFNADPLLTNAGDVVG